MNKKLKELKVKRNITGERLKIAAEMGEQTKGAKIDPVLRLYTGSHNMCITNEDLSKGRGNAMLCKCTKVKLKKEKNEDGRIGREGRSARSL